ncbi:DUF3261 domain-containing protein [Arenimonas sp.]|uniref:DUF3261 domain-containing protein n=1 Tax=Arenimonas sp. TaxID=1872635 RepID=UPI0025D65314|nr:DUF3261 domain-containing protein [Arenimonas sp.]
MQRLTTLLLVALLSACAGAPPRPAAGTVDLPMLGLAPSALPGGLVREQRLVFEHGERRDAVDALVEVDAHAVRVVLHQQGQVVLRMHWDGERLDQQRDPGLPDSLDAARVLTDLQLVHWPAAAITTALPAGWHLDEGPGRRDLWQGAQQVLAIEYPAAGEARLHNHRLGYRLTVVSSGARP